MVEVDESAVKNHLGSPSFILRNPDGKEIPWQKTHNGKIIFQADVLPGDSAIYVAESGDPAPVKPLVYGRLSANAPTT